MKQQRAVFDSQIFSSLSDFRLCKASLGCGIVFSIIYSCHGNTKKNFFKKKVLQAVRVLLIPAMC